MNPHRAQDLELLTRVAKQERRGEKRTPRQRETLIARYRKKALPPKVYDGALKTR